MPRSRSPSVYPVIQLILRVVALLLGIVAPTFLIYLSARFKRNFPVACVAAVWAICLDTTEIIAISDRKRLIPRLPVLWLLILELEALGLLAGGCVTVAFADLGEQNNRPGYEYPADPWRLYAFSIQVAVGAFLCLISRLQLRELL